MARSKPKIKIADVKVERWKLKDISPADYNPRTITDESLVGLGKSVDEFGYVEPLIVNKRTGRLISGHQRFKVLTLREVEEVDVVIVDLDEAKEKALNITMNNQMIQGDWTNNLGDLLNELQENDSINIFDLSFDMLALEMKIPLLSDEKLSEEKSDDGVDKDFDYRLIIECDDEKQQADLIDRFVKEGLKCQALIV